MSNDKRWNAYAPVADCTTGASLALALAYLGWESRCDSESGFGGGDGGGGVEGGMWMWM